MKKATAFPRHGFHCNFVMKIGVRVGMVVALFCLLFNTVASAVHLSGACGAHEVSQECSLFHHPHTHHETGDSLPRYSRSEDSSHSLACLLCFWKSIAVPVTVAADTLQFPDFCCSLFASGAGRLVSHRTSTCRNRGPPGV